MADVARVAGVSTTTVSHVLNKTRKVAHETEELVRQALESTGYRHNLAARALATQSTDTVGLAMAVVTNPYFAALVKSIEQQLRAAGFTLVLADTNDDPNVELDVINHLLERRVSGLIVLPLEGSPPLNRCLQDLLDQHFPLVFLDRRSPLKCDQVFSECVVSTHKLTSHLASLGHTRIGFVRGAAGSTSAEDRLGGYLKAVDDLKLAKGADLIIDGESDEAVAEKAVARYFSTAKEPVTALVITNNQMTLGTLRALKRCGLKVPRDIALACYDDFEWADLFDPQITTMAQNSVALGDNVVELLLARIADPSRSPQTVVIPTSFQHRDSCGCGRRKNRGLKKESR